MASVKTHIAYAIVPFFYSFVMGSMLYWNECMTPAHTVENKHMTLITKYDWLRVVLLIMVTHACANWGTQQELMQSPDRYGVDPELQPVEYLGCVNGEPIIALESRFHNNYTVHSGQVVVTFTRNGSSQKPEELASKLQKKNLSPGHKAIIGATTAYCMPKKYTAGGSTEETIIPLPLPPDTYKARTYLFDDKGNVFYDKSDHSLAVPEAKFTKDGKKIDPRSITVTITGAQFTSKPQADGSSEHSFSFKAIVNPLPKDAEVGFILIDKDSDTKDAKEFLREMLFRGTKLPDNRWPSQKLYLRKGKEGKYFAFCYAGQETEVKGIVDPIHLVGNSRVHCCVYRPQDDLLVVSNNHIDLKVAESPALRIGLDTQSVGIKSLIGIGEDSKAPAAASMDISKLVLRVWGDITQEQVTPDGPIHTGVVFVEEKGTPLTDDNLKAQLSGIGDIEPERFLPARAPYVVYKGPDISNSRRSTHMIKVQYAQNPGETCPLQPGKSYQAYLWVMKDDKVFVSRTGQSFSIPPPSVVPHADITLEVEPGVKTKFVFDKKGDHKVPEYEGHVGCLLVGGKENKEDLKQCTLEDIREPIEAWIQERLERGLDKTPYNGNITDDVKGILVWEGSPEAPYNKLDPGKHYNVFCISYYVPITSRGSTGKANMIFINKKDQDPVKKEVSRE